MSLVIEPIRSQTCLSSFRCGVKEIEAFSKKAFKNHSKPYPDFRVRVLYADGKDVGFYSISVTQPNEGGRILDKKQLYTGASAYLYIDHLAVRVSEQGKKHSTTLMVDLIELAFNTMQNFGRIFAIGLNAADKSAISFFEKWGFVTTSESTNPFMILERESLNALYDEIFNSDA